MLDSSINKIHFIGIGGCGMSAIAWVLLKRGYAVSGSDMTSNANTARLAEAGATIHRGHASEHIGAADIVVASTAIPETNPEIAAARQQNTPIWQRARMLAAIMAPGRSIAVAGAHGKTTTTSMIGYLLKRAGLDPTVLIGGELNDFGGNAHVGRPDLFVAEADESDGSFLLYEPHLAVVTNIEADHLDHWKSFDALQDGYEQFLRRLRPGGKAVLCIDGAEARRALERTRVEAITYGISSPTAEWTADSIEPVPGGTRFSCVHSGERLGAVELSVPGRHNVCNALATLAVASELGVSFDECQSILPGFRGAGRRWERVGAVNGVTVIDDYAHHPTEIAATLEAARSANPDGRIYAIFQPHRYSRTSLFGSQFGPAFRDADMALITDVYAAGETPIDGVSGEVIFHSVQSNGSPEAHYLPDPGTAPSFLLDRLKPGDLVLTMGAGDIWQVGRPLLDALRDRAASAESA